MSSPISPLPSSPKASPHALVATSQATAQNSATLRLDPIIEHVATDHHHQRQTSAGTVSFRGNSKDFETSIKTKSRRPSRIKDASPPPPLRYRHHASFDNFSSGEATDKNTVSFTMNVRHKGYQHKRRSRCFMVGIDENDYSDIALSWMLEELVDDGDEIVCLRVVDRDSKITTDRNLEQKKYQREAKDLMESIQKKNSQNRGISIILEFSVGKVVTTFQRMIQIYEPAMLIVGTRGRSLGGFQGLVSNRNSFSKWCLQYSPIPVVVVRPTEKREKKKEKRKNDPGRRDYARILKESGVDLHETNMLATDWELADPEQEAIEVAKVLGLPAPTHLVKELEETIRLKKIDSGRSEATSWSDTGLNSRPQSPLVSKVPQLSRTASPAASAEESDEEEEDDDDAEFFEAVPGHLLLDNEPEEADKKKKLHEMEVGEAKALANGRKLSIGSNENDEDSPSPGPTSPVIEEGAKYEETNDEEMKDEETKEVDRTEDAE